MSLAKRGPLPWLLGMACVVIVVSGLRAAAGILNPMLMAGFLALLFQPLTRRLRRWGVAGGAAVGLVVLAVVLAGLLLVAFVGVSLRQLALQMPQYGDRLSGLVAQVSTELAKHGIDAGSYMEGALRGPEIGRAVLNASGAIASGLSNLALTFFIFAFMLGGMWELERRASTRSRDHSPLAARFLAFSETIRGYMGVRAVLGLIAAVLDYALLEAMGVDYALLWGVLSFLLSFVPNIGFTLSLVPPTLLALVEKGWPSALIVLIAYQVINNVIDNVIGPRFVGREMKISALLSFLSVIFWAWVLGATGAILAVPLTVLIRDLAFGPADPDVGAPQPVTPSTVPMPPEFVQDQPPAQDPIPAAEEAAHDEALREDAQAEAIESEDVPLQPPVRAEPAMDEVLNEVVYPDETPPADEPAVEPVADPEPRRETEPG
ncbi:MAG TPA: AI-2E family transporter [Longimicrobium sp.]|nr:AI-2E family transporter [Longimicrobium sp.]